MTTELPPVTKPVVDAENTAGPKSSLAPIAEITDDPTDINRFEQKWKAEDAEAAPRDPLWAGHVPTQDAESAVPAVDAGEHGGGKGWSGAQHGKVARTKFKSRAPLSHPLPRLIGPAQRQGQ